MNSFLINHRANIMRLVSLRICHSWSKHSSLVFPQFATPRLRHHPLATRALPAHAPYVAASVRPNAPPGRCGDLSPVLHTEDLTVRFGRLPTLNRVNSEASETKGLALDVIAPLTR